MMDRKDRTKYYNILNELYNPANNDSFADFLDTPCKERWEAVEDANFTDYSLASGASKGVIIDYDLDYVIKIPFLYEYYTRKGETVLSDFDNYCSLEESVYDCAKTYGLNDFFAESFFLGYFHNVPIYLMKRVDASCEICSDITISGLVESGLDEDKASDAYYNALEENDTALVKLLFDLYYDEDEVDDLIDFLERQQVNDLHDGNIGFDAHDNPVLIDYSGYR